MKNVFDHAKRRQSHTSSTEVKQMINAAVAVALAKQSPEVDTRKIDSAIAVASGNQNQEWEARMAAMMKQFSGLQTPIHRSAQSRHEENICMDVEPQSHSERASSPDPFADLPTVHKLLS